MTPERYRKRPVEIEAVQLAAASFWDVASWVGLPEDCCDPIALALYIPTLEGVMTAALGDWIIRGVKGEFYACKPEIFEATYTDAAAEGEAVTVTQYGTRLRGTTEYYFYPDRDYAVGAAKGWAAEFDAAEERVVTTITGPWRPIDTATPEGAA